MAVLTLSLRIALLAVALLGHVALVHGQDEDDYGGEEPDYGGDEPGYGEGGGDYDDYPPGDDSGGYGGGEPPPAGGTTELTSVEEFEEFLDNNDASVVGAFAASEIVDPAASMPEGWDEDEDGAWAPPMIENPILSGFKAVADAVPGYRYALTSAPEVLERLKSKSGGVYLYRSPKFVSKEHGDRPRERFPSGKITESAMANWLSAKAQPLVGEYIATTKDRYKQPVLVIFLNLDFESNAKGVSYVLKRARKLAAALKDKKMAVAVASSSGMSYELGDFGLASPKSSADILMGIATPTGSYYSAAGTPFTASAASEFANGFLDGKLTPYEKPDDPPPSEDDEASVDEADGEDEFKDEP